MRTDDAPSLTAMITTMIVFFILGAVVRAYLISTLWGWFIVAPFNLPGISLSTAFGFSLIAGLFTAMPQADTKDKSWWDAVGMMSGQFASYAVTLVVGWFVHIFAA